MSMILIVSVITVAIAFFTKNDNKSNDNNGKKLNQKLKETNKKNKKKQASENIKNEEGLLFTVPTSNLKRPLWGSRGLRSYQEEVRFQNNKKPLFRPYIGEARSPDNKKRIFHLDGPSSEGTLIVNFIVTLIGNLKPNALNPKPLKTLNPLTPKPLNPKPSRNLSLNLQGFFILRPSPKPLRLLYFKEPPFRWRRSWPPRQVLPRRRRRRPLICLRTSRRRGS